MEIQESIDKLFEEKRMMKKSDIGMIGLAVMGENLALNFESKGFLVSAFDIRSDAVQKFEKGRALGKNIQCFTSLEEFISSLSKPRKVMMMIRAGNPVDQVIDQLIPLLEKGDIIIDGGNSHYPDTLRRVEKVENEGLLFIGTGVSGGEEGALNGPSIMPGGSKKAWPLVKPLLQSISAKVDGEACCDWVGEGGAGHFVKMVHNGIEYGDIQLISESYQLLRDLLLLKPKQLHQVYSDWNQTELNSYLIEITAQIFSVVDSDNHPLIDKILDTAGQKGTGKWTASTALDEGVPLTLIAESVFARFLSSMKEERVNASKEFNKKIIPFEGNAQNFILDVQKALFVSKIISYAQGYELMRSAANHYQWNLNFGGIALMWRGGCIIRSSFLSKIKEAYDHNPNLSNLLLDPYFKEKILSQIPSLRRVVSAGVISGIPLPSMSAALAYFDGYTTEKLPANLLQAQRDFFGAHTYERIDQPRGTFFHTNWTGMGGDTSSTTYNG